MKTTIASYFRRNAVTIALCVIAFCVLAIIALQALTIQSLSQQVAAQNATLDQLKGITKTISHNADQRTKQINSLDRHMDCIVQFFSQPYRTNKAIADIDQCQITGVTRATTPTGATQSKASRAPQSGANASSGAAAPQSQQSQPQGSSAPQPSTIQRVVNPIVQLINGII